MADRRAPAATVGQHHTMTHDGHIITSVRGDCRAVGRPCRIHVSPLRPQPRQGRSGRARDPAMLPSSTSSSPAVWSSNGIVTLSGVPMARSK